MKFKKIPNDYFITILDRLTRLEPAEVRYNRVFDDIINKFSIDVKAKNLSLSEKIDLACEIFNSSLELEADNEKLKSILLALEDKYFIKNETSKLFLNAPLNLASMIKAVDNIPLHLKNVIWLKNIVENNINIDNLEPEREAKGLLYPIKQIILCEGETENILLKTFFDRFDYDLDKKGVYVLAAGGKNQVARKYYKMKEYIKLPFFILLDKDAMQIKSLIQPKLRKTDSIYLINSGEFEDLIPREILVKTVNNIHQNELNCSLSDFEDELSNVHNLENIYRKYGFGEYKKADFAKNLKEFIDTNKDNIDFNDTEVKNIIEALKAL